VKEDPDDNRIMECAVEAGSDFLITHDKDLLRIGNFRDIQIVTAVAFLNRALAR
jgi:predicted nucleic acid-binding protein